MSDVITKATIFTSLSTAASATSTSFPQQGINMNELAVEGYFSLHVTATGTGTATIGMEISPDAGATWIKPVATGALTTALTLLTGVTVTSGADGDGVIFAQVDNIPTNELIRFYVTETGTSNAIVISMDLIAQ